jgi:hypothetical protein
LFQKTGVPSFTPELPDSVIISKKLFVATFPVK